MKDHHLCPSSRLATLRPLSSRKAGCGAIRVGRQTLQLDCYDYSASSNPPVLHRKETFLAEDYPGYEMFAELTRREEERGLLKEASRIGNREGWEERLREAGVRIEGHAVVESQREAGSGEPE